MMKIIRDDQTATFTLFPADDAERQVLAGIAELLKPGEKLVYGGRSWEEEGSRYLMVYLHAGAVAKPVVEKRGSVTIHDRVFVGGIKLVLRGTSEADKEIVWDIRDACYWGSGGLVFLGTSEVDGETAIVTTAMHCKLCGAAMIERTSCEWGICDECSEKCVHQYVRGAVHGGSLEIGVGEYCQICGRGKPKAESERKKSQIEHHLAVERELNIHVIYKEGPFVGPQEVANAVRLTRRYMKSQSRRV